MDRNTLTATALIGLILVLWFTVFSPAPPVPGPNVAADTVAVAEAPVAQVPTLTPADTTLGAAARGSARTITVQTERYTATLSTRGATLTGFRLRDYQHPDRTTPVEMVDTAQAGGALGLVFSTPQNRTVDTRALYFESTAPDVVAVTGDSVVVPFEARIANGGLLRMAYVFHAETHEIGLRVERQNSAAFATGGHELVWYGAVPFSEDDRKDEIFRSGAYARSAGEVQGVTFVGDASATQTLSGQVDWVAVKNKFFLAALIPTRPTRSAEIEGTRTGEADAPTATLDMSARLDMAPVADGTVDRYRLYVGPMEYLALRRMGGDLYDTIDFGWDWMEWMTRPIAKLVFVPFFTFFGGLFGSYGLVLILFAFAIKLVTHPLSRAQAKSMLKMRAVGPRMQAIKERYKDDPQKQQQATMALYKQAGVNPLGGCLPMLLQYPVLIALYQYIPQSILLRQQPFLWAADLSAPDPVLQLPFSIPFYGNFVSGFAVLMALSLIVQMRVQAKVQPVSTPEQAAQMKMMQWLFPIMLLVFFNLTASGLSLYYLFYNVFSALEQWWIRKTTPEIELPDDDHAETVVAKPTGPRSTPPKRKLEAQVAGAATAAPTSNGRRKR